MTQLGGEITLLYECYETGPALLMRKDANCNFFLKLGMVIKRIITISIKNVTGKVPELLLTRKTINLLVIWRE